MKLAFRLTQDIVYVGLGVAIAIIFSKFNAVSELLEILGSVELASFLGGIFFTSLFTIAPASVLLVELASYGDPISVAIFGALGAVVGDMILFVFVRDRLSEDIMTFVRAGFKRVHFHTVHRRMFRWILPLLGAFFIALPFPNEFGIMLLGLSHMKTRYIIPLSFLMNFIGVLLVIAVGNLAR